MMFCARKPITEYLFVNDSIFVFIQYIINETKKTEMESEYLKEKESETTAWLSVEATGLDVTKARIVKIDILVVRDKKVSKSLNTMVNPTIPIPPETTVVNGITDAMVADAPKFSEISATVMNFISGCDTIGGDAVSFFDLPVLMAEFEREEIPLSFIGKRIIDTHDLYKTYCRSDLMDKLRMRLTPEEYVKLVDYTNRNESCNNDAFYSLMLYRSMVKDFDITDESVDEICGNDSRIDLAGFFKRDKDKNILIKKGKYADMDINDVDTSFFTWMMKNKNLGYDTRDVARRIVLCRNNKG